MATLYEFDKAKLVRAANDVAGILAGALVGLYQAPIDLSPANTLATFTGATADYNTYATQPLVFADPSIADDGTVEVVAENLIFRPTDGLAPNSVWGLYITDTTAAYLLFAGQFDGAPLPLNTVQQQVIVTIRYRPADGSVCVQIN